jgi:phospholipid/cholesterol/gamma-HCH transport system substrate-binding protein
MDERRLEIKVGALLLVAVVAGLALLGLMGEISFSRGPRVQVEFSHTGNVVKGAPVKLGGVPVGRVDRIVLTPDRRDAEGEPLPVLLELSISSDTYAALRSDAAVTVATQGILGEPYLELYTGSAQKPPMDPSRPLRGTDAPRLDLVASRLSHFLGSASKVLEDDPEALSRLVSGVSGLSHSMNDVLSDNRADLKTLTRELTEAAQELRALAVLARKNMEPGGRASGMLDDAAASAHVLKQDLPQLSLEARTVLAGLANATSGLTPEDGQKLHAAIERYAKAGESLDVLAERGDRILARIEAGQGTLGGLNKDPEVYQDLKALVTDLKKHPWKVLWKE